MQYKFINVPVFNSEDSELELNKFIRSNRIISIKSELVEYNNNPYWSYVVEYVKDKNKSEFIDNRKNKIDYREVLSEEDFAIYSSLRDLRKKISEKEAIPVYTIFTNEQLAQITQKRVVSIAELSKIDGIGKSRLNKYADEFLSLMIGILGKN